MKRNIKFFWGLLVCSALLSLSGCNIFDDIFGSKDYGAYTSITFQIRATYGGVNSEGFHKFTVNNQVLNNSHFVFNVLSGCNDTCSGAVYQDTLTFTATIDSSTCTATQQYIDWIYWKYNNNSTNCKCLTTSYEASVTGYTYEDGKDDPGTPVISGLEQLEALNNCSGNFSTDCETTVTLRFTSSHAAEKIQAIPSAVQVKQFCSDGKIK
jgi:hypothetical protein